MTIKRLILYTFLAVFNGYLLWPSPSAGKVYRGQASSIVKIQRFEKLTIETPFGVLCLPWSPKYSKGSGVIISKSGYILTARHVAANCGLFVITTQGGQVYEAGVLGIDPDADLAILQPVRGTPRGFSVARAYAHASIGDPVVHIGCPLEFDWCLTQGVVSWVGEELMVSDAVINPGSSGGALFDIRGRLIGIASGLRSPVHAYVGHSIFIGPGEVTRFLDIWRVQCH